MGKKKSDKLSHAGYQYYLHSQYPSTGVATTFYYRCIHIRKLCSLKMSLKDGNLTVKEYHTCVKEKQSAVLDATQRMSDQVRTIAVAEPTKPAVQIANEVMEAVIEEYEGKLKYII